MSGESEGEDGMCDYERQRLENIRKNHSMLRSLGLPLPAKPKMVAAVSKRAGRRGRGGKKGKGRKKVYSDSDSSFECDSESSEDEWQPWKEETKKKPRGKAVQKITPLDAQSKQQIFNAAKTEIRSKLKTLKEGRKKAAVRQRCVMAVDEPKKKGKNAKIEAVKELFWSDDDEEEEEEEFIGFTREEVEKACQDLCCKVPGVGRELWEAAFGEDDENIENNFEGFSQDEIVSTEVPDVSKYGRERRDRERVDYQEAVISDDDEYLFCEDCQAIHHGDCPVHGALSPLPDIGNDLNSKQFTKLPVPAQLTVKMSSISGAGLGVFANQSIDRGVKFGPYVGKKVPSSHVDEDTDTSYMWEIKQEGVKSYFIDGRDEEYSNWLRFINCARNEDEQNLVAFQYKGHIYYRTFKTIYPGNELLVWYGEEYAKDLGITVEQSGEQARHMCRGCGLSFVEKSSFDIHLRHNRKCSDANPREFKCGKCQRTFGKLSQLQEHIRRHQEYEKENLEVHQCDELEEVSFYDKPKSLVKKKGCGFRQHRCQYCGKVFTGARDLHVHIRIHTGEKPYKCHYCGKSFSDPSALRGHLRLHTGNKPYKCPHCGQSFTQSSSLSSHLQTHTGDKPYKCPHCNKSFSRSGNLRTHLRTHTGDKPYKCPHCNKSFTQSGNLRTHLQTHTGDRPYKCPHCNKSFSDPNALRGHLCLHTGDRPYKCPHCGQSFTQSSSLSSHIRTHHSHKSHQSPSSDSLDHHTLKKPVIT